MGNGSIILLGLVFVAFYVLLALTLAINTVM